MAYVNETSEGKAEGNADGKLEPSAVSPAESTEKDLEDKAKAEAAARLVEYGGKVPFGKLLSLASVGEKILFGAGCVSALCTGYGQILLCITFGDLLEDAGAETGMDTMKGVAGEAALFGIIICVSGVLQGFAFSYFVDLQQQKMRPLYLDVALHRDVSWFDTHNAAAMAMEMADEIDKYGEGLGPKLGIMFMSLSQCIGGLVTGFFYCWQLALVMCASVPFMTLGMVIMGTAVEELTNETQGAYTKAATVVEECLYAVRTVVSFGGEKRELARYSLAVEAARRGGVMVRFKTGLGMGYFMACWMWATALAFYASMWFKYDSFLGWEIPDISVGKIMIVFNCVLIGGMSLGQLGPSYIALNDAQNAMARFFHLLNNEATIQRRVPDDLPEFRDTIATMELRDVHFSYPARPDVKILDGLSLSIQAGQKVALVGESGSGKSTVMALLERFYDPDQGSVLINGQDMRQFSVKSIRRMIGYVGQEPVLFATTIEKNILQGCSGASKDEVAAVVKQAQMDFVDRLPAGLGTYVGSGGSQFSGGQKQRIAIARALLKKPMALFLDEATSALDSASERQIQETIDHLGQMNSGMTILAIAHRLSTIQNSDVICVLQAGKMIERGGHAELLALEGMYSALAAGQKLAAVAEETESVELSSIQLASKSASKERGATLGISTSKTMSGAEKETDQEKAREKEIAKTYKVPMSRLMSFCKPEWALIIPGLLFAVVSGAAMPVMASEFMIHAMWAFFHPDQYVYDAMMGKGPHAGDTALGVPPNLAAAEQAGKDAMRTDIEWATWGFIVAGAARMVAQAAQMSLFGLVGEGMTMRVRKALLTAILRQNVGFHDSPEHTPGQLTKALQIYAFRVSNLCISFGDKADAFGTLATGIFLGFYYDWRMSLGVIGTVPILGAVQAIQIQMQMGGQKQENDALKEAGQLTSDALTNARTVQACGSEKVLVDLYQDITASSRQGVFRKHGMSGLAFGISQAAILWIMAAMFLLFAWLVDEGLSTFDRGMKAMFAIMYGGSMMGMAFAFTGDLGKAKVAAHDMFQLLDTKSEINGLEPTGETPTQLGEPGRLQFVDVEFFYPFRPDVQVLRGVAFTVEAGQSVGVVGPSGGGKSTVMAMIQRFYNPQKGRILVGSGSGRALDELNIRWWRRQIGFVGQEPILFNTSVLNNVKYGMEEDEEVSNEWLEKCKQMAHLTFLDKEHAHGWDTPVGPRGSCLSGGQKQRVAICRALIRNPAVLLLDEATSALDTESERVVSAALEAARQDRTSFAIAHRLSTIQSCDKILVVSDGKIVEQGNHATLLAKGGVYYKLSQQH